MYQFYIDKAHGFNRGFQENPDLINVFLCIPNHLFKPTVETEGIGSKHSRLFEPMVETMGCIKFY